MKERPKCDESLRGISEMVDHTTHVYVIEPRPDVVPATMIIGAARRGVIRVRLSRRLAEVVSVSVIQPSYEATLLRCGPGRDGSLN